MKNIKQHYSSKRSRDLYAKNYKKTISPLFEVLASSKPEELEQNMLILLNTVIKSDKDGLFRTYDSTTLQKNGNSEPVFIAHMGAAATVAQAIDMYPAPSDKTYQKIYKIASELENPFNHEMDRDSAWNELNLLVKDMSKK